MEYLSGIQKSIADEESIAVLKLDKTIHKALIRSGIRTVGELKTAFEKKSHKDFIQAHRNIGLKRYSELAVKMRELFGL